MDFSKLLVSFLLKSFLCVAVWGVVDGQSQPHVFTVTEFGAIADGKTDNSKALSNAWERACAIDGGMVLIPEGVFFVGGTNFEGPCNGRTLFQVRGTLLASEDPSNDEDYWIQFRGIDGLTILGHGTFDGNGKLAWARNDDGRPTSIKLIKVTNGLIQDIHSVNSKRFHFHIARCSNLIVNNIVIQAPGDSPNTDGIHTGNSDHIWITNSRIGTGDDCISIGDGMTNINISRIVCGPGHGISIGSIGKHENEENVSGVRVTNCTIKGAENGVRIKTMTPSSRPLSVSDVTFANIRVDNVKNPIVIDQFYGTSKLGGQSSVEIRDVRFIDVKGTSATEMGVRAFCSEASPCKDVAFSRLNIKEVGNGAPTIGQCSNCDTRFVGPSPQVPSQCS